MSMTKYFILSLEVYNKKADFLEQYTVCKSVFFRTRPSNTLFHFRV